MMHSEDSRSDSFRSKVGDDLSQHKRSLDMRDSPFLFIVLGLPFYSMYGQSRSFLYFFLVGIRTFVRCGCFTGLTMDIGPLVTCVEHIITIYDLYIYIYMMAMDDYYGQFEFNVLVLLLFIVSRVCMDYRSIICARDALMALVFQKNLFPQLIEKKFTSIFVIK